MSKEFRYVIRLLGTGLDGTLKVPYSITTIKGVGLNLAQCVVKAADVDPVARLGDLSDNELKRIEDVLRNPLAHGIPARMLNRQRSMDTGNDVHLMGPDLDLYQKDDITLMKDIRSWKGIRHAYGLKVRGQKTRTTGRKGKSVGVSKKQLQQQQPTPGA